MTKVINIKDSCGNGNGCSVQPYILPYLVKEVKVIKINKPAILKAA